MVAQVVCVMAVPNEPVREPGLGRGIMWSVI